MAGGNRSKDKGSTGERELCKLLGTIFEGSFIRVPNSGSFIGGKNAARREVLSEGQVRGAKGDIIPPDFMPKLVLESKWYKEFRFHNLMKPGPVPLLDAWIAQTLEAVQPGDLYFICFKVNGRGRYVAAPYDPAYVVGNHCVYQSVSGKFLVTELEPFFSENRDLIKQRAA
jgi:hypothetical protein